jgi:hypothetical protein
MANQELRLLSLMLQRGDFTPLQEGLIESSDFGTDGAQHVVEFIHNYKDITNGAARYPSLSIIRDRFGDTIELPDPDPGDEMKALVYEVRLNKLRTDLKLHADTIELLSDVVDPLEELGLVVKNLRRSIDRVQRDEGLELGQGLPPLLEKYENGEILQQGIPWLWPSLDREFKGKRGGEFHVFIGRPKQRKTFIAMADLLYPVVTTGSRALIFSTEMPVDQIFMRAVATMSAVRYRELKNSGLDEAELMRFMDLAERFGNWKEEDDAYDLRLKGDFSLPPDALPPGIRIVNAAGKTVSWCKTQIENWRPDGVLIDSFYKLAPEGMRKSDADWKAVTAVSRGVKDLAMETDVPISGTHQLNRGAEGKIADLGNVALADAIGQDVDSMFQVVTGKVEDGSQVSALWNMAARESEINGVIIHNIPCANFNEIAPIESLDQVKALLVSVEGEDDDEHKRGKGKKDTVDAKKHKEAADKLEKRFAREAIRKRVEEGRE